jgi:hypothetical protein
MTEAQAQLQSIDRRLKEFSVAGKDHAETLTKVLQDANQHQNDVMEFITQEVAEALERGHRLEQEKTLLEQKVRMLSHANEVLAGLLQVNISRSCYHSAYV